MGIGSPQPSLQNSARFYQLHDSLISNTEIARHLNAQNGDQASMGFPSCCFFVDGRIAAIRTKPDELVIFHVYERLQAKMPELGCQMK